MYLLCLSIAGSRRHVHNLHRLLPLVGSTCLRLLSMGHPKQSVAGCPSASHSLASWAASRGSKASCSPTIAPCFFCLLCSSSCCSWPSRAHTLVRTLPVAVTRHGFARNSPWKLVGSSVEESATSITMQLTKETLRTADEESICPVRRRHDVALIPGLGVAILHILVARA